MKLVMATVLRLVDWEMAESPKENSPGQSESASDAWVNGPQNFQDLKGRQIFQRNA